MKLHSSIATSADVLRVIEYARDAELCRNLEHFRGILSVFWDDITAEPELGSFDPSVQPELLRLCGVFLSQFGRAKGLDDYQNRGKDILSHAARLFEAQNCPDKAAETKVGLATCYWYSGEIEEHDAMLRSVEAEFSARPDHKVLIQIKLNRVLVAIWRKDLDEANSLIAEVTAVISPDHDLRLRTQFQNLAGIVCRMGGDLERSAIHANEAVRIAREANNDMFVAFNLNNLAFVERISGNLEQACRTIDEAISIMESRGDEGWLAHALDTKAVIYLDQCDYSEALKAIEKAILIFSKGEDYSGWTDALWTKCVCLLRLDRTGEAVRLFADLTEIAAHQIGQVAVDKFAALFADELYTLKHFPLLDEVAAFKRSRVVEAMRASKGHVANAARLLGLRSQQHLSDILNNQFPDIYDELGIRRRKQRSNSRAARKSAQPPVPGVTRLLMPKDRTFSFNFGLRGPAEPEFFLFPKNMMQDEFGVKTDAVVAVMPALPDSLYEGAPVLYIKDDIFRVGAFRFDEFSGLFLVDLEEFTFLSDVQLLGIPVGFCRASDRSKRTMKFDPLRLVKKG